MDKVNNIIYLRMWKNTFNYKGTTKRLLFWIDLLIHLLITIALLVLIERSSLAKTMFWYLLVMIFFYLPFLSMATRRIRDIGEPPLLSLISLSGIGIIVVLILCLEKSKELLPSEKVKKRRTYNVLLSIYNNRKYIYGNSKIYIITNIAITLVFH